MSTTYKPKGKITDFKVLEPEATYSYADYLRWEFEERVELIKGKLFKMSPAPKRNHQDINLTLSAEIYNYLKGKRCKVYSAPFDVRLPSGPQDPDSKTYTVVQPDICVVCDLTKLDDAGCKGAPDLIVEVLSPATAAKDLHDKYELYQEHGVKEYWVVYPGENVIELFELDKSLKYHSRGKFVKGDTIESKALNGFSLNLDEVFKED